MPDTPNVPARVIGPEEDQRILARLAVAYVAASETKALYEEARAAAGEVLERLGGKRPALDVELPGLGFVAEAKRDRTPDEVVVEDRKAWTAYVETHHQGAIEYVVQVLSTWEKARLKALKERADFETGVVADENGEPIPGLRAKRGGALKQTSLLKIGENQERVWDWLLDNARPALGAGEQPQSSVSNAIPMPGAPTPSEVEHGQPGHDCTFYRCVQPEVVDAVVVEEEGPDLREIGRQARLADQADELAPGVTRREAEEAARHAVLVQGGYSTPEIEAQRIAEDRWRFWEPVLDELPTMRRGDLRSTIEEWNYRYPDRVLRLTGNLSQFREWLTGAISSLKPRSEVIR